MLLSGRYEIQPQFLAFLSFSRFARVFLFSTTPHDAISYFTVGGRENAKRIVFVVFLSAGLLRFFILRFTLSAQEAKTFHQCFIAAVVISILAIIVPNAQLRSFRQASRKERKKDTKKENDTFLELRDNGFVTGSRPRTSLRQKDQVEPTKIKKEKEKNTRDGDGTKEGNSKGGGCE